MPSESYYRELAKQYGKAGMELPPEIAAEIERLDREKAERQRAESDAALQRHRAAMAGPAVPPDDLIRRLRDIPTGQPCPDCGGSGVNQNSWGAAGSDTAALMCGTCSGTGRVDFVAGGGLKTVVERLREIAGVDDEPF